MIEEGVRYWNGTDCEGKGFVIIGGLRSTESTTYFRVPSRVLLCLLGVLALAVVLRCGKPRRVRKGNESP